MSISTYDSVIINTVIAWKVQKKKKEKFSISSIL